MDPRDRADALLSRARARGGFVVTPDNMTSPFDSSNTQKIPRAVVDDLDDGETTAVVSSSVVASAVLESDHHLADEQPTTRLDSPPPHLRAQPTTPLPQPGGRRRDEGGLPGLDGDEGEGGGYVEEEEVGGLIPTVTQRSRSTLSRRLDGN